MEYEALATGEGGAECVRKVAVKWKEKGATLKGIEGPAIHPLNRDSSEREVTECVDKW